jgi:hypothetical protein
MDLTLIVIMQLARHMFGENPAAEPTNRPVALRLLCKSRDNSTPRDVVGNMLLVVKVYDGVLLSPLLHSIKLATRVGDLGYLLCVLYILKLIPGQWGQVCSTHECLPKCIIAMLHESSNPSKVSLASYLPSSMCRRWRIMF